MDHPMIDVIIKVGVPLITFGLGVMVTLITKRAEKRRSELKERVTAISKLVNDWYNQVHELGVEVSTRKDKSDLNRAIYFYVRNRLVLPELVLHIEFLRSRNAVPELLRAVDEFLEVVTTSQKVTGVQMRIVDTRLCKNLFVDPDQMARSEDIKVMLAILDAKLQAVTHISAGILANKI
jgi:hypothetical protein